jgi:hypothetical protein
MVDAANELDVVPRAASRDAAWRDSFVVFAASRAALFLLSWIVLRTAPAEAVGGRWFAFPDWPWLDGWARFDSGWYWTIIERGYYFHDDTVSNVAFFPLYPLASYVIGLPFRAIAEPNQAFMLGGMVVSHGCFYLALVGIHRLGTDLFGRDAARRALWLISLYPFAFFYSAVYTESLYLALAVWALLFALRERWGWACALAALCAVARPPGGLVAIAVGVQYLASRRLDPRRFGWEALWFLVVPLPLLALLWHFQIRCGDAFVFWKAQAFWGRSAGGGLRDLFLGLRALRRPQLPLAEKLLVTWYVGSFYAAIGLTVAFARRLGAGLTAFAVASLLLQVAAGFMSAGRMFGVIFPLFLAAGAVLRRPTAFVALLVLFAAFLGYFTIQFVRWELVM